MPSAYKDNFRLIPCEEDPKVTLSLSAPLLKDLMKRSKENGRSIEVEIALRLARSLDDIEFSPEDFLDDSGFFEGKKKK